MIQLFEQVLQTRDVVLFDQRGVGQSKPVVVWRSDESLPLDAFETEEKAVNFVRSQHEKAIASFKERGIDLTGYNTIENADDVNDLRQAIGAKKVNLLGFSYGTHLGLATMRRHSEHLESVILIGTEGLNHTYKLPSVYNDQIKKLSDLAAQDETVKEKVPDMTALLKRVLDKFEKEPVTISVLDRKKNQPVDIKIGKYGLQLLIRFDVGDSNDFVDFPRWFYTMDKGDYSILKSYAERRYNQLGSGVSGMSVMMDLFSGATKERLKQIEKESKDSILGNAVNFMDLNIADLWGKPDLGDDFRKPLKTNIRTLFISGTMDSNTPTEQTEEIRKDFSNSNHLILQYGGHEDSLPNQEVQKAIVEFLNGQNIGNRTINQPKPKFKPIP
jgi:pimeloyl-ACP methyl ester carboxylesterase